ncbi:MAG: DUF3105 domain-containing protein [Dehalococcoidia bacterium]
MLVAIVVLAVALAATVVVTALGGGGGESTETTPTAQPTTVDRLSPEQTAEADDDASLPGEYVDLAAIYGGAYGTRPGTSAHVTYAMDYSPQGLPPAGGPHWGSAACGQDPSSSPPLCGPAPWGIYREPWPAETLVHNMEHAGVIVWYNTADEDVIDQLETFATENLNDDVTLVLAPYPNMAMETVAITVWGRRDLMPATELDLDRLQEFIDMLYCRFDPEGFC